MTVTFYPDKVRIGKTGIRYPFLLVIPGFCTMQGKVTYTTRGTLEVAFPVGVEVKPGLPATVLAEYEKQIGGEWRK